MNHDAILAFEITDELWQVSFQKTRFLYELFEMADGSDFFSDSPPDSLPDDVLWAVLEAFLSESLGKIESLTGHLVKIKAPVKPSPFKCFNLGFEIIYDGASNEKQINEKQINTKLNNAKLKQKFPGILQIPLNEACVSLLENLLSFRNEEGPK